MICSRCGKETAQIFMRRVRDEDARMALCPACNRELSQGAAGDLLPYSEGAGRAGGACPACGATMEDFRRTGLLGCAYCYTAFAGELLPVIRSVQQNAERHSGPPPKGEAAENYDRIRNLIDRRDSLKDAIEQALKQHRYARAKELEGLLRETGEELKELNREIADRRGG